MEPRDLFLQVPTLLVIPTDMEDQRVRVVIITLARLDNGISASVPAENTHPAAFALHVPPNAAQENISVRNAPQILTFNVKHVQRGITARMNTADLL